MYVECSGCRPGRARDCVASVTPAETRTAPGHVAGGCFYVARLELLPGVVVVVEHEGAIVATPEHQPTGKGLPGSGNASLFVSSPAEFVTNQDSRLHVLLAPDLAKTTLWLEEAGRRYDADVPFGLPLCPTVHKALPLAIVVQSIDQAQVATPEHVAVHTALFGTPGRLLGLHRAPETSSKTGIGGPDIAKSEHWRDRAG